MAFIGVQRFNLLMVKRLSYKVTLRAPTPPEGREERMPERFITVQDAAEQLQVHPQTVRVWLRQGKLRGRLIGGRKSGYRIPASEIERLLTPDEAPVEQTP
jgi:excisionase family DNA binding protein